MFKFTCNELPNACHCYLVLHNASHSLYNFRHNSDFNILTFRTSIREKSISMRGPRHWDSLPSEIRSAPSSYSFKLNLRKYIVHSYYS